MDVSWLRMREATIVAALPLTAGVSGLGIIYVALTWSRPHRFELLLLFIVSVLSCAPPFRMREKIVRSRWREVFFLSWTLSDLVMLVTGTLADGGARSPLVIVFFLPIVFSAMSYPMASIVVLGVASELSYVAVVLIAGGASVSYEVGFAFVLLATATISAWQAQNHNRQHRALGTVSRTDHLTGCLNRRGFGERVEAHLRRMGRDGTSGAILMLDIDHFKPVNDRFGHAAGDELLCWVSDTLEGAVRPSDAVGRLGGDEFAVLFVDIDAIQARLLATRLDEKLSARAPSSLGLAVFPDDGQNLDDLTRKADIRLYAARQARRRGAEERRAALAAGASDARAIANGEAAGYVPPSQHGQAAGHERPSLPGAGSAQPHPAEPGAGTAGEEATPIELWRAALDDFTRSNLPAALDGNDLESVLLDQVDASVMVVDLEGRVISWNSGAEALYGWTREEALGSNVRELIVPADPAAAEQLSTELQRDGRWDGELVVRHKDGSAFAAYVRNRLIVGRDGAPAGVVGVAVDISKRIAAESELLQSRDYAHAVTECMGEGLFTLDTNGRVTYVNDVAQRTLGRSREEIIGRDVDAVICAPPANGATRRFEDSPFGRALAEMDTVRVDDDVFVTADGEHLPVSYTATPVRTDAGVQGCVVIFGDISERKRRDAESRRDGELLATINRVESALIDERLVLHAQPIIDLRTRRIVQHELLLRMREPDGQLVAPDEFLPVAEQYALVGEIDWWVIKEATRIAGAGCPVQVNVSARSVGDPDVLEHIERCVQQNRVPAGTLVFEITETAIIDDEQTALTFVESLHELGCLAALDDFGTGWASLTYLKQIPVDFLKLDIEFIRDLATSSASLHVVEAVANLARDFHLKTIAEGVEDAATLELLATLEVDFAQGFHIARPQPFDKLPGDSVTATRTRSRRHTQQTIASPARAAAGRRA
ncbi:MAG TPA: EAL domain-containing protein [Solirubrobacteraceae bacterium]